ncbi:MAG: Lrp/AsnC family transcriptional regulator [Candidatus Heimdallarchaeota archaeon]
MVKAYIHISTNPGKMRDVLNACLSIPGVVEGHMILGAYDIIIELEQDSVSNLMRIVEQKIHIIPGIRSTTTSVCFETGM